MGKDSGTSTSTTELDPAIREAAIANLGIADEVSALGYTPYTGPTVAALQPGHMAAMGGTNAMAAAMGLPQAQNPMAGLPPVQQFAGGLAGYSPMDLYRQSINDIGPAQRAAIESFVMDPQTGARPTNPSVPQPGFSYAGAPGFGLGDMLGGQSAPRQMAPQQSAPNYWDLA